MENLSRVFQKQIRKKTQEEIEFHNLSFYEFLVLGKMLVNLSKRNDEKCPNIF